MREAKNLALLWKIKINVRSGATLLKRLNLSDQIFCVHRSLKQCWIWTWQEVLIQHYVFQQLCRGITNVFFPTPDLSKLQKGRGEKDRVWEKKSQHIEWDKTIGRDLSLNESLRSSFKVEVREMWSPIGWNIYSIMNSYILLCAVENDWVVCIRPELDRDVHWSWDLKKKKKSVHEELYPKLCLAGGILEINNSCLSSPYEVPV